MHWSLVPVWLGAIGICAAQTDLGLSTELPALAKIKAHMREVLSHQPNYTCVEEIERSKRAGPGRKYEPVDMIRVEVALVDGRELFAWPGSGKFEDAELEKMVPAGGAIGNGNFALFARAVFDGRAATFGPRAEADLNGTHTLKYDFRIPQMQSGYHIRSGDREAVVGYHGSFWANAENFDVVRLDVTVDDIPPSYDLTQSTTTMEYSRVKIGQSVFLLPTASELAMIRLNGEESRNRIHFKGCRKYSGESMLSFGDAPADLPAVAMPKSKRNVTIPGNILFEAALGSDVDSEHSMVGDAVVATLRQDIKIARRTIVPKGATLTGRIVLLTRHADQCMVDLLFSEVESEDTHSTVDARIEVSPFSALNGASPGLARRQEDGMCGRRIHLPKGLRLVLKTHVLPPSAPE